MARPWLDENWIAGSSAHAAGVYWRAVEAQHVVATMRLVDSLSEQDVLEQILEASKPPLAAGTQSLHYLLSTPFRYTSPHASRFRRAHAPGVWYGADSPETACAEVGFWRWRFFMDSAGLRDSELITEHTLFQAAVAGEALQLDRPPWSRLSRLWTHKADYGPCHELADAARAAGVQWLAYRSVRARDGRCAAVFDAGTLRLHQPTSQQTWVCKVSAARVLFRRGGEGLSLDPQDWV